MKFKNAEDAAGKHRTLTVKDKEGDTVRVEIQGKSVYLNTENFDGVVLTRSKALKLAWAIIDELNPSVL